MKPQVTDGIQVSVKVTYRPDHSDPHRHSYLFSYRITIENNSDHTVQLMRRHWVIFDSCGEFREVEGEGVVGLQPVLRPGDIHEYESACNLTTDMGKMRGTYLMVRQKDGKQFKVEVPEFELIAPNRLN